MRSHLSTVLCTKDKKAPSNLVIIIKGEGNGKSRKRVDLPGPHRPRYAAAPRVSVLSPSPPRRREGQGIISPEEESP